MASKFYSRYIKPMMVRSESGTALSPTWWIDYQNEAYNTFYTNDLSTIRIEADKVKKLEDG